MLWRVGALRHGHREGETLDIGLMSDLSNVSDTTYLAHGRFGGAPPATPSIRRVSDESGSPYARCSPRRGGRASRARKFAGRLTQR
jgi:hypothetical protein